MENKIDINKKYRTRDGREVRLFTTESRNKSHTVVGEVLNREGEWWTCRWTPDGFCNEDRSSYSFDLVEVKEKIKLDGFLGIFRTHNEELSCSIFKSVEHAKECLKAVGMEPEAVLDLSKYNIEFEKGEGLS